MTEFGNPGYEGPYHNDIRWDSSGGRNTRGRAMLCPPCPCLSPEVARKVNKRDPKAMLRALLEADGLPHSILCDMAKDFFAQGVKSARRSHL